MDSPWDDVPNGNAHKEVEWARISNEFTNAGYREGITRGKESALQEGFDAGFADFGAPLGRDLGVIRGLTSAILSFPQATPMLPLDLGKESITSELRDVASSLSRIRCSDIMPPDLEAEEHARQHLDDEDSVLSEELTQKRDMEGLEDMIERMSTGTAEGKRTLSWTTGSDRSPMDDTEVLKTRLKALVGRLGLKLDGI